MSLKYGLLGLLNYGSMTGYELDKAFKASLSFFWQAKTSQLYRELAAMERGGWLTSERVIQTDKPNKRVYSITEEGKKALSEWLSLPQADIEDAMCVKSAFLMRVFFAGEMEPSKALEMLRTYRDRCIESGKHLREAYGSISEYGAIVEDDKKSKYWEMTVLYGEIFLDAGLQWAEKSIAMLEEAGE